MNVVCENGWLEFLNQFVAAALRIRLFVNDHDPDLTDTFAAYTDATFSGYPGFTALTWGAAFVNLSDQGEVDALQIIWQHNGGATDELVYGAYVTDGSDNLLFADRFDAPVSMATAADSLEYQSVLTVINQ